MTGWLRNRHLWTLSDVRWATAALTILILGTFTGVMVAVSPAAQTSPKLLVVGNGGKCSLSSGSTFRFVGKGFTPNGKAQVLVYYPKGHTFPFGHDPNPGGFYWYFTHFGIYPVDSRGGFSSRSWDCRNGPANTQDFVGKYEVIGLDRASDQTAPKIAFRVMP